jgi:iron complex outermembrane receptor protein
MHLPELKAVANLGYDELSGRSYGNTDAKYLNGVAGSGYNNTYENTGTRSNKLMDLFLNYNKSSCDQYSNRFNGGYSYQDFRDNVMDLFNFQNNITVDGVPVPSRKPIIFLLEQLLLLQTSI